MKKQFVNLIITVCVVIVLIMGLFISKKLFFNLNYNGFQMKGNELTRDVDNLLLHSEVSGVARSLGLVSNPIKETVLGKRNWLISAR